VVNPSLYSELPLAEPVHAKRGSPKVIAESLHRRNPPVWFARGAVQNTNGQLVVTIGEHSGGNRDVVACDAPYRMTTAIQLRHHVLDDHSIETMFRLLHVRSFRAGFVARSKMSL
jgi:hypothetical protein